MAAPRTHTKPHGELTPEAFLARVRESASGAEEAVAEFLTAVEQGCRLIEDMETLVGEDGFLEDVFVAKWSGAVRPECKDALESSTELVRVFVSPPPGETLDITAPYTPPANLAPDAATLRRTHRTAVNLCLTLRTIRDRLKTNVEPWILADEIDKLTTLKDTLRSCVVKPDTNTPPDPLTSLEQQVFDIIKSPPDGNGIQGDEICREMKRQHGRELDQSTLTTHIIPALKAYGVKNRQRVGYYVSAT